MKKRRYTICVLLLVLLWGAFASSALADPASKREYQVKAAFLYNFIKFVDWPKEKEKESSNEPITIGVIGKDPFEDAFDSMKEKQVKSREVAIQYFKGYAELEEAGQKEKGKAHPKVEDIRKCHLLFISSSEKKYAKEIIESVAQNSVLTVADTSGLLEAGCAINFLREENKIRFEINMIAADKAQLKVRSKLLRLAKKVVQ